MKSAISRPAFVSFVAVVVLFCAYGGVCAESPGSIKLNEDAFAFAARLIKEGQVIADGKGAWNKHRPSVDQENEFIRLHGFGEYAKWHLGVDARYPVNTKRRYKFHTAISTVLIAAVCLRQKPGLARMVMWKSKR